MKKILIISNFYYPHIGGIEQTAHDCAEALLEGGNQVKVICFNDENNNSTEFIDGVQVIKCAAKCKFASQVISPSFANTLKSEMKDFSPDIVIFNYPNPFAAHYILKYITKRMRFVLYWHSDIIKQKILRTLFVFQNNKLLRRADIIVATSPNYIIGSKYLQKYKEKCAVIPSCIRTDRLSLSQEEIDDVGKIREKYRGQIVCIAVGRHVKYKGFEYLVRACQHLNDNIVVFLVGEGPLTNRLKELSSSLSNIRFLGRLNDEQLRKYLSVADIFCFPSITKNEAFGLSLAEAMYVGLPAITFTIPGSGVNYVSVDGETGIEVPNKNVIQYANAINRLADDNELRQNMGKHAKERVTQLFLFDNFVKNIQGIVRQVTKEE